MRARVQTRAASTMMAAASLYLDKDQIPILSEAIESGLRPLPDEK